MKLSMDSFTILVGGCTDLHDAVHHAGISCDEVTVVLGEEAFKAILAMTTDIRPDIDTAGVKFCVIGGMLIAREGLTSAEISAYRKGLLDERQKAYLGTVEVSGHA